MGRTYYRWPQEAVEDLHQLWGLMPSKQIANRLNGAYGMSLTRYAVCAKAVREGLSVHLSQGWPTVTEAAIDLGVSVTGLMNHIERHNLKIKGRVKGLKYIPDETMAQLRAFYAPVTEPAVKLSEAARQLNYSKSYLEKLVPHRVRAIKKGCRWLVPVAEVERIQREGVGA